MIEASATSVSALPAMLVAQARAGDTEAFDRLTAMHIDSAYRTALAILRSEQDALDVVQDAFVSAWRELPRLREPDRFAAWLGRIIANRCRSALRHRRVVNLRVVARIDEAEGSVAALTDPRTPVADVIADADAIRRAFERLRPDDRILITLHHVEGRPVTEVAALLGIAEGTAKWRLHAARDALARKLEDERR